MRVGLRLHRFFGIEVSGQDFVFHIDQFQRFFGDGFRDGDYAGDVIADVANLVERQRVLIVADGKNAVGIGRVFADCYGDDAVEMFGAGRVDAFDARMRIRRMQNLADQHAGHAEVVGVFARAGGLFRRVDHRGGLADDGEPLFIHEDRLCDKCFVAPSEASNLLLPLLPLSLRSGHAFPLRRNRRPDRRIHLVVARAAAKIAAQGGANVFFRRIGIFREQRLHRHNESRSADSRTARRPSRRTPFESRPGCHVRSRLRSS